MLQKGQHLSLIAPFCRTPAAAVASDSSRTFSCTTSRAALFGAPSARILGSSFFQKKKKKEKKNQPQTGLWDEAKRQGTDGRECKR
jgi:hypothetical protein